MGGIKDLDSFRRYRKAEAERDCRLITVRDVLQDMVEKIDSGEIDADACVVIYRRAGTENEPERYSDYGYRCAGLSALEVYGLLARGQHILLEDVED